VLLATGMRYEPPDLPGLDGLWGDSVFHCPFCHGWELRDRPLAVYGREPEALQRALLLTGWSDDVVVLSDGPAPFDAEGRARLSAAGVSVDERRVARLDAAGGALRAVVFEDGGELPRAGLLVHAPLRPRSRLAEDLGVGFTEAGTVAVDEWGATGVPGVYAAGDVAAPIQQVALAVAAGSRAGVAIARDLIVGETA
jgi:thioredoxin reductase